METTLGDRLSGYSGISLAVLLIGAFAFVQPVLQNVDAIGVEALPGYDDCRVASINLMAVAPPPEDPISMNTVRSGNIVKTVHAEKEIFRCQLDQGSLFVAVDLTVYIEIYENIVTREILSTSALSVTCLKEPGLGFSGGATVIDCESKPVSTTTVPVGNNCEEIPSHITHPQEMNTVNKGSIAKTIEAQKEVFVCKLDLIKPPPPSSGCLEGPTDPFCFNVLKKVDIILFTDIYENLATQTLEEVQFHSVRCVVLITNDNLNQDPDDDVRDATVESCKFSTIQN